MQGSGGGGEDGAARDAYRLTVHEQELVSVVLATRPAADGDAEAGQSERRELAAELSRFGMQAEWLDDGSLVATLVRAGNATDQAAQAARAALELGERFSAVALATGRGVVKGRLPVGEVIDRAGQLLLAEAATADGKAALAGVVLDEVSAALLDARFVLSATRSGWRLSGERRNADETRPLLGKPTQCVGREPELGMLEALLAGCRDDSVACAVLIKAPQGLGKSRLWHEFTRRLRVRGEEVEIWCGRGDVMTPGSAYFILARALQSLCQVVGGEPPLAQQHKLRERIGRNLEAAEKQRIVEFIGELCGVPFADGESPALRAARSDPKELARAIRQAFVDFLRAECLSRPVLLGLDDLQWGDAHSVALVGAALRELAELPLLVVALGRPELGATFPELWADKVQEISLSGLSRKASERLIVEALGSKVEPATLGRLVAQSAGNALYLEELIRAEASGRGEKLPESILAMLQSRLSHLEPGARRLLRAASVFGETFWRGGVRALLRGQKPPTTPAPALAPPSQTLIEVTMPDSQPDSELDGWLSVLADAEIIERHPDSRLPDDVEYGFRHGLLREAAYGMLTPADLRLGHRLAAGFLAAAGQVGQGQSPMPGSSAIAAPPTPRRQPQCASPGVLAEHFQRGGELLQAARFYLRAAEQALSGNDLAGGLLCAERGAECIRALPVVNDPPFDAEIDADAAPDIAPATDSSRHAQPDDGAAAGSRGRAELTERGELLGSLRALQALAHFWRGEWGQANAAGREAMLLVPGGNFRWNHPMRASFLMLFGHPTRAKPASA